MYINAGRRIKISLRSQGAIYKMEDCHRLRAMMMIRCTFGTPLIQPHFMLAVAKYIKVL